MNSLNVSKNSMRKLKLKDIKETQKKIGNLIKFYIYYMKEPGLECGGLILELMDIDIIFVSFS